MSKLDKLQQHFKKGTEHIRMTDAEKSAMRLHIQQAMNAASVHISYTPRTPSPYAWLIAPRSFAMLMVALIVIVSTGSAYAAQGSLPGAPLYSVKTDILEPLTVALAPNTQAKAQANATIATTRVQEAQTLAAQGTLTPQTAKQISDNYNAHAEAALALAADVDAQNNITDTTDTSDHTAPIEMTVRTAHDDSDAAGGTVTALAQPAVPPSASTTTDATVAVQTNIVVPMALSVSLHTDSPDETHATSSNSHSDERSRSDVSAQVKVQKNSAGITAPMNVSIQASSTATTTQSFVRTLKASLSAQAKILQNIDAQLRLQQNSSGRDRDTNSK